MPFHLPPSDVLTRRRFLAGLAAGAAAAVVPRRLIAAAAAPPVWALLADTHINEDPDKHERGSTMSVNLRAALAEVAAVSPAGVVIAGDFAHHWGKPADYRVALDILDPFRRQGLGFHMALGNHDHRENFRAALGESDDGAVEGKRVSAFLADGVHWLFLDSLEEVNKSPGALGDAQRRWLAGRLDARPDVPAIIVLHHNIEDKPGSLTDSPAFLDVLRPRRQAKAVFFGHTHWYGRREVDGLHLVNLPPTGYVFSPKPPLGWVRAELYPDRMDIELRSLDPTHPKHGRRETLAWR